VLRVHLWDGGPLPWVGALIAIPPLRSVGFRFSFCYVASSPLSVCLPLAGLCCVVSVMRFDDAVSFRGVRLPVVRPFSVVVKNFAVKRRMFVLVCCPVLYEDS